MEILYLMHQSTLYGVNIWLEFRLLEIVNKDQIDVLNYSKDSTAIYDRKLKLEVWYPADVTAEKLVDYEDVLGKNANADRPLIPFTFLVAPPVMHRYC